MHQFITRLFRQFVLYWKLRGIYLAAGIPFFLNLDRLIYHSQEIWKDAHNQSRENFDEDPRTRPTLINRKTANHADCNHFFRSQIVECTIRWISKWRSHVAPRRKWWTTSNLSLETTLAREWNVASIVQHRIETSIEALLKRLPFPNQWNSMMFRNEDCNARQSRGLVGGNALIGNQTIHEREDFYRPKNIRCLSDGKHCGNVDP